MWKEFLTNSCETEASPTLYQHITDLLFNSISEKFPVMSSSEAKKDEDIQLDYNERNAVGGYVTRALYS